MDIIMDIWCLAYLLFSLGTIVFLENKISDIKKSAAEDEKKYSAFINKQEQEHRATVADLGSKLLEMDVEYTSLEGDYKQLEHSLISERTIVNTINSGPYKVWEMNGHKLKKQVDVQSLRQRVM